MEDDDAFDWTWIDSITTSTLTGLLIALVFGQFAFSAIGLVVVILISLFLIYRDPVRPVHILMFEIVGYTSAALLGFYILHASGVRVSSDSEKDSLPMTAMLSYNLIALWFPSRARYEFVFRWATGLPSGAFKVAGAVLLFSFEMLSGYLGYDVVHRRWVVAILSFSAVSLGFSVFMLVLKAVLSILRRR